MVRAKFRVDCIKLYADGRAEIEMSPVTSGSEENKQFWKYTPAGNLKMQIDNPDAVSKFIPGKEYYVDFIEA